uniref:RHEB like 1 n=1 Tax=Bos mutus grunniens TaxID=30521 RepID=A0A8B9W594_BOSMU
MSFTYTWWTQQGRMSTAFCPIHSSLGSMVMCLCILSPLCIASKSLRVCTKSYMKATGKPGTCHRG